MRYVKVEWHHAFSDEPVAYYSELGLDGYETRKVQLFRDGRSEWADEENETASVGLSEVAFPAISEISGQPEFDAQEISAEEFERVWLNSRDGS